MQNYNDIVERKKAIKCPPIRHKHNKHKLGYFFHIASARSGHNFVRNNIISWTKEDGFPHIRRHQNLENYPPEFFNTAIQNCEIEKYPHSITVIQTRDLLNWFASHCSFFTPDGAPKLEHFHIEIWRRITQEFFGETDYLSQNFIPVLYDDFFRSEEYRRNVCEQIPFAVYNDDELNIVTRAGRGSTFDGLDYDGRAQEMNVLERYKDVGEENLHWWKVLAEHPEAIELYLKHFDVSTEKKEFIDSIYN